MASFRIRVRIVAAHIHGHCCGHRSGHCHGHCREYCRGQTWTLPRTVPWTAVDIAADTASDVAAGVALTFQRIFGVRGHCRGNYSGYFPLSRTLSPWALSHTFPFTADIAVGCRGHSRGCGRGPCPWESWQLLHRLATAPDCHQYPGRSADIRGKSWLAVGVTAGHRGYPRN